ncbi:MAG: hypothetical protein IKJ87_08310 [Ruminococcus sp.]|nr:hypothetical protein [Ruminococcus sp.]
MSFVGKLHEISLYTLITTIILFVLKKGNILYIFCAFILFIAIALIGAILTKKYDNGEGLTFNSDKLLVIIFAHIAEEILGLVLTPIWFIKDLITKKWNAWKVFDYITYFIEVIVAIIIILSL